MVFQLSGCDIGFTINSVNYAIDNVVRVEIEDQERTRLTRGGNAGNKVGLAYRDGIRQPKILRVPSLAIPKALFDLLVSCYEEETRIGFYCVVRSDGSSKIGENCVISLRPQQLTVDNSEESLEVSVELETFDLKETHKS